MRYTIPHFWRPASVVLAGLALSVLTVTTAMGQNGKNDNRAKTRPIQDFLSVQTSGTYPCCGAWSDPNKTRLAWVDWAGVISRQIVANGGISLGTTADGSIVERPLDDGTAEVTVLVHSTNVYVYVTDYNLDPLFGNTPDDVTAGAEAAVGKSVVNVVFINSAPGAPLPDLMQIFVMGQVRFFAMNSTASGLLNANFGVPSGTPGGFQMTQTGVYQSQGSGGRLGDFYPAEHINLSVAKN